MPFLSRNSSNMSFYGKRARRDNILPVTMTAATAAEFAVPAKIIRRSAFDDGIQSNWNSVWAHSCANKLNVNAAIINGVNNLTFTPGEWRISPIQHISYLHLWNIYNLVFSRMEFESKPKFKKKKKSTNCINEKMWCRVFCFQLLEYIGSCKCVYVNPSPPKWWWQAHSLLIIAWAKSYLATGELRICRWSLCA